MVEIVTKLNLNSLSIMYRELHQSDIRAFTKQIAIMIRLNKAMNTELTI